MAEFKAGDIFIFNLNSDEWMTGRVMLNINQQCVQHRLLKPDSPLSSYNGAILIEVYRSVSKSPTVGSAELLIPGMFVSSDSLEQGTWKVIEFQKVDPTRVEFPESFLQLGLQLHFVTGEISLPIESKALIPEVSSIRGAKYPSGRLNEICLYHLGRENEIHVSANVLYLRNLARSDIRFTNHRSEVYKLLGEKEDISYYELSTRLGYDSRRFFNIKKKDESYVSNTSHLIIACPYCLSPINEDQIICPYCTEDTSHDAGYEMTPEQYFTAERKACPSCGKLKFELATICPYCRSEDRKGV